MPSMERVSAQCCCFKYISTDWHMYCYGIILMTTELRVNSASSPNGFLTLAIVYYSFVRYGLIFTVLP